MIIDLQRRLAEIGRIRIGQQVQSANGKTRPAKLETFRLTSPDQTRIQYAAGLYGGTPKPWQAPAGKQWEVVTTTTALQVIVPPSDMAFSQHYEMWSAGGCQRRCDGRNESISDGPCLCDPDKRDCDIHTRLSVLLADLPGLGVWRIDTSGYYAAVELQGAVEVIQIAAGRGQMLPARLRLEQRVVKRPGEDGKPVTRRFAVPVLDIEMSPGQLLGGARPALGAPEPARVDAAAPLALPSAPSSPPFTPVPTSVPTRPARSIAEQMQQQPQTKPRANAAQPIASTGLEPRKAAAAAAQAASGPKTQQGPPSTASQVPAAQPAGGEPPDAPVPPSPPAARLPLREDAHGGESDTGQDRVVGGRPQPESGTVSSRPEGKGGGAPSPGSAPAPAPDEPDLDGDEDLFGRQAPPNMLTAVQAGFTDIGVRDRAVKLRMASQWLGREVFTLGTLNIADATRVLNELGLVKAQEPQSQEEPGGADNESP